MRKVEKYLVQTSRKIIHIKTTWRIINHSQSLNRKIANQSASIEKFGGRKPWNMNLSESDHFFLVYSKRRWCQWTFLQNRFQNRTFSLFLLPLFSSTLLLLFTIKIASFSPLAFLELFQICLIWIPITPRRFQKVFQKLFRKNCS